MHDIPQTRAAAPLLGRREMFHSLGAAAAAGFTLANHAVAADDAAGGQVADRSSSIRITGIKTYWVGPIVYLKLETNHGIAGWGEVKGTDPRVGKFCVESLFLIHEFYPENARLNPPGILRMEYAYADDGTFGLPPGPGLGVEVDGKLLAAEAAKPQTYTWPGQKLKDCSVAEY